MLDQLIAMGVDANIAAIMVKAAEKAASKPTKKELNIPTLESLEAAGVSREIAEAMIKAAQPRSIKAAMDKYSPGYIKSASGNSKICGDRVSRALDGLSWERVCGLADQIKGEQSGHHAAKYINLNNGQRRMNAGNRIRRAYQDAIRDANKKDITKIEKLLAMKSILD